MFNCKESNSRCSFKVALEILWHNQHIAIVRGKICEIQFLNQAQAGHRLTCVWFLKIVSVQISVCVCVFVHVCVCPPMRLLITSGVIWTPYDWLNKLYSCYITIVVMGMASALISVVDTNPLSVSQCCIKC